jgi:DNA-binding transcriptional MerR regulator
MFRIGDFSRLTDVSVKALRYYDEVGLLKPTYVDRDTRYRYYSAALLPRLNRILAFDELFDELHRRLKHRGASFERGAIWHTCAGQRRDIDCEAILFLREPAPVAGRAKVYELPGAYVACVIHQGSDETCERAYVAARSWIKSHGFAIAGPNRELYWQGAVEQGAGSSVTEIQYPIIHTSLAGSAGH